MIGQYLIRYVPLAKSTKKRGPVGGNFEIEIVLLQENQTNPASICSMELEFPSRTVTPVAAEYY